MVVSTENKLLFSHTNLNSRSLKNPLLETHSTKQSLLLSSRSQTVRKSQPATKNNLLRRLSPTSTLENSLLKKTEKPKELVVSGKQNFELSCENKVLVSLGKPSLRRDGLGVVSRNSLVNHLLANADKLTKRRDLRNSNLHNNLKSPGLRGLSTKNTLLAPNFSLGQTRSAVVYHTRVGDINDQDKSEFNKQIAVEALNEDELSEIMPKSGEIKFPTVDVIKQRHENVPSPITDLKISLIDCVCTSLINHPVWFNPNDATRSTLHQISEKLSNSEPEFVLKVALYSRLDLNIRTTSNFLLAVSSILPPCRPYLKKYFNKAILLPSDWIQVAEFYQSLADPDGTKNNNTLPSALRKVMVTKFPNFDEYQLAKYNKDKSKSAKKKKKGKKDDKKVEKTKTRQNTEGNNQEQEEEVEKKLKLYVPSYTLKYLIRKLHITKPAQPVMRILGKKYPDSVEAFYKTGLEGTWDSALAGKRMKLDVPETWETQVSAKGNAAKTWQDLLDHKKLPFMAMLRNIRNMIKVGMSEKHHNQVIRTLTNERAVSRSRQFPFRFFSAYEALSDLEKEFEKQAMYKKHGVKYFLTRQQKYFVEIKREFGDPHEKSKEEKQVDFIRKQVCKKYSKPFLYSQELIDRYRKALDTAVKIATVSNVPPISGHTVVFCDFRPEVMQKRCMSSKGLGSNRTLADVGILLGLMCAYSCEACTFLICSGKRYRVIELESGGILENLKRITRLMEHGQSDKHGFLPTAFLNDVLLERMKIDNILLLSSALETHERENLNMFMERYRDNINQYLMCYEVDLAGKRVSISNDEISNNILRFSGYSDQILKYLALGKSEAQLNFVANVDKRYELVSQESSNISLEKSTPVLVRTPQPKPWRTVRVFISSTIKDMVSERDALVQKVFPLLREHAKKKRMHVIEADLRWGITGEDSKYDRSVGICLQEVRKCDIFIGILGERYGWVPKDYGFSAKGCEWLEDYPKNRSITELEIAQATFIDDSNKKDCYFYYKDSTKMKNDIPKFMKDTFFEQKSSKKSKLRDLKQRISEIRNSHIRIYHPEYEGIVNGNAVFGCLEEFEEMVLNDLIKGLDKIQSNEMKTEEKISDETHMDTQNQILSQQTFVARSSLLFSFMNKITAARKNPETSCSIVALTGKIGSGKSSLLSAVQKKLTNLPNVISCIYYASSFAKSQPSIPLYQLCCQVSKVYGVEDLHIQNDSESLIGTFSKLMNRLKALNVATPSLYLLLDDIDVFGANIDWIHRFHLDNLTIVVTCVDMGLAHKALKHLAGVSFQHMPDLSISDKRQIVRSILGVHSKKLDESHFNNQLQIVLSKHGSSNPLYLSNVCEMMRVEETFESLTKSLKNLPHELDKLLELQLQAIEARFNSHHGIVASILGLVYCSANWGISEENLFNALSLRFSKDVSCSTEMLPRAVIFALLNSLRGFFVQSENGGNTILSLRPSIHQNVVEEKYVWNSEFVKSCHITLANFYTIGIRKYHAGESGDMAVIATSLTKLPFHLASSGQQERLKQLLIDFGFIETKCRLGHGMQLLNDFSLIKNENKKKFVSKRAVVQNPLKPWEETHKFLKSSIHIIARYPDMLYQTALNQTKGSYPYVTALGKLSSCKLGDECKMVCIEQGMKSISDSLCLQAYSEGLINDIHTCVSTHHESKFVAWGSLTGKVGLMRKGDGKEINTWIGHSDAVTALCFINKAILISSSVDGMISIWNTEERYKVRSFKAHNRKISDITVRPLRQGSSGRIFATGSHDCSIALWNVSNLKLAHRLQTNGSCVNCLSFHPTDPRVVAGLWDASIRIWDVQTSKRVAVIRGHSQAVSSVEFSHCGKYIASCSLFESVIRLWAAGAGIPLGNFSETYLTSPKSLTFSYNGEYLIGSGEGANKSVAQLAVWNAHLGSKEISYLVPDPEDFGNALCCQFNGAKDMLAVGFHEGYVAVYDPKLPQSTFTCKISDSAITCLSWTNSSSNANNNLLFMAEGSYHELIIAGTMDRDLKALDPSTQSVCALFEGHTDPVLAIDCSAGWIASSGEDFSILVWETGNLQGFAGTQNIFGFEMQNVTQTNFAQSNVLNEDSPKNIKYTKSLHGHDGPVSCLSFNSDGTMLVSGGRDGKIAYWDISVLNNHNEVPVSNQIQMRQGKRQQLQNGFEPAAVIDQAHMDWITCCSWNDGSDHIVTGSNDSTLKIWGCPKLPLDGGKEYKIPLHILKGHQSGIASVVYRFGSIVSTGGEDGTIRIWSHKGIEITNLKTELRTNCCDVMLQLDDIDDEDAEAPLNFDDDKREDTINWAEEVATEEWNEEHEKRKPGAKRKRKAVAAKMQNFDVACASNGAQISLWKPLVGNKVVTMSEQAKSVNDLMVNGEGEFISCSSNGAIKSWNIVKSNDDQAHNGEVTAIIAFEHVVVTSCDAGFLYLWQFDVNGDLTLLYKARGHSKRISAMQPLKENAFATISYDHTMMVWSIIMTQNSNDEFNIQVSLQKNHVSTVSRYPLISFPTSTCIDMKLDFLIGDMQGMIYDCSIAEDLDDSKTFYMNIEKMHGHKLFACINDPDLHSNVFRLTDKGRVFGGKNIPLINAEFLHSFALAEGFSSKKVYIVGSSNGFVYIPMIDVTKKLHNDRISVILDSGNFLVTASYDCSIKVWSKPELKQIGQFFTNSPVTSACFSSESVIIYGDSSGMMHTLTLHFANL